MPLVLAAVALWRLWPPSSGGWAFWALGAFAVVTWLSQRAVANAYRFERAALIYELGAVRPDDLDLIAVDRTARQSPPVRFWARASIVLGVGLLAASAVALAV
jgi:hypothetical protein